MTRSSRPHIWIACSWLATAKKILHARAVARSASGSRFRLQREAEAVIAVEQRGRIARARAFDREQAKLGRNSAIGGETSGPAAGRKHAMTGNNDRKRISSKRLPDIARQAALAESRRELSVGERVTRCDAARRFVDPAIELGHAVHVERDGGKIPRLARQERGDGLDRMPHLWRRRAFPRMRIAPHETRMGSRLARLRQLHAADAARTPRDAALGR